MNHKIIFDTDPGVDDAMAIQVLLNSPEVEIVGLTTIYGNVDLEKTTANALRLLDIAKRLEIPVAKGVAKPLSRDFGGGVAFVHGEDGQGNTFYEPSSNRIHPLPAVDFIADRVQKFPNQITLVAVGPLTNLANFINKYPQLISHVKEVIIMGGNAFCLGNASPAAEANILNDPEAADIVFSTYWPISMIGLDVTEKVLMTSEQLEEIALKSSDLNKFVSKATVFYREFYQKNNKIDGIFVHDSSAVAYLLNRDLFTTNSYPLVVETTDSLSLGKTWPMVDKEPDYEENVRLKPWQDRPMVNICVEVDSEAVLKLIIKRLY